MERFADLHTHTTHSDGILATEALLHKAAERGLSALSITDHDTVDALPEANVLASALGLDFVTGIEISAYDGTTEEAREYHILGYFFDMYNPALLQFTDHCRHQRIERAERMVVKLNRLGIPLHFEEVLQQSGKGVVGRQHIAAALHTGGFVRSYKEAFDRYIADDRPANEVKWHFPVSAAIDLIHEAGGLAVVAHPGRSMHGLTLVNMVKAGLDGIEVAHPSHDAALRRYYEQFAKAYHLFTTGGSDFHGSKYADETNFGTIGVPYENVLAMAEAHNRAVDIEW